MNPRMNKITESLKEKIIIGLVFSMLSTGGVFLWNAGTEIWHLPWTVRELKHNRAQDSIRAVQYIIRIEKLERRNTLDSMYLESDYRNLAKIKQKLKIK